MPYAPGTLSFRQDGPTRAERERARKASWDARRGTAHQRGYDSKWQKARRGYLAKHPLCVRCLDEDRVVPSTVVDHVQPHRGDKGLFWDSGNWQSLCGSCHDAKTAGEDRQALYMPAGLAPSRPPLVIVAGAPGSGKSTYVAGRAGAGDVVIDVDAIIAEQTGSAERVWTRPVLECALTERNARLRALAESEAERAWFIVTAARLEARRQWADALGACEIAVCYAAATECKARIVADWTRRNVWQEQSAAVDRWHAAFTYRAAETVVRTDSGAGAGRKL